MTAVEVKSRRLSTWRRSLRVFESRFQAQLSLQVGKGGVPLEEFLSVPVARWVTDP